MPFVVFKDMNPIVQTVQENSRNLKSIPTWVLEIPTIIRLSLRRNNISLLPTDIAQLSQLKRLDLSENQLYSIPAEVGFLTGLEILQLASNHISALPRTLGKCVNLQGSDKARKSHGAKAASLDGTIAHALCGFDVFRFASPSNTIRAVRHRYKRKPSLTSRQNE